MSVSLLADIWRHIRYHVGREMDPKLASYFFFPAFIVAISSLYIQFVLYTNASISKKVLLGVSFVVLFVAFSPQGRT